MAIVIRALDGAQGRNFPRYDDAPDAEAEFLAASPL
jgi:hypothetical protein